jgi:superfamily I DNA/RNA helicase
MKLNPSNLLNGLDLFPYQSAFAANQSRFKIGLWACQTGKDHTATAEAVVDCQQNAGTQWIKLAADETKFFLVPLALSAFAFKLRPRMINLSSLNPQQRLAVETINGPVLILAGAGTGKTRVITYRIAHMIGRGVNPGNVLAVTFTNKAAREMQERVRELVPNRKKDDGEKPERATICTFHSLCVRILRKHIELLGYKRNFVIYSESDQLGAMKKVLSNLSAKGEKVEPRAILSILSRFKNGGADAAKLSDPSAVFVAQHVRERYQQALHACNAVDFDDLILLTLRLFKEHPDALEACRDKYRYVMVDEYQDTNGAQFELVHALTQSHRNFCVVGDDDQSIYGWRGAEIANLLDWRSTIRRSKSLSSSKITAQRTPF